MAEPTQVAFGDGNHGVQVGLNTGSITNEFHLPLEIPPEPYLTIPFRRDADYVDREALLDQIHHASSKPASRAALVGLGGVGKSQLAIEYAYRKNDEVAKTSHPTWVFWIHAESRARVEDGFRYIADTVKISGRKQLDADVPQLWLRSVANGPWFLILDNADNASVLFDVDRSPTDLTDATEAKDSRRRALWIYLLQSSHGAILITTRNKKVAQKLTDDYKNIIGVYLMDEEHALILLERKAALVEALEYMPLAITPRTSMGEYLKEFRKSKRRKLSLLNRDEGDLRRDRDASNSVIGIPESLLRPRDHTSTSEDSTGRTFEDDILILRNYSLISMDETGAVYEMHSLVQLATRRWLSAEERTEPFKEQFMNRIAYVFPTGDYSNWTLFAHVEGAINHRPKSGKPLEEWAQILYNSSWYARSQGKYSLAETMAKKSRDARMEALGRDHELTWDSVSIMGQVYHDQGKYREAERTLVDVLLIRKQKLRVEHPHTLISMSNLASTYRKQGRWDEAETLQVEMMEISQQKLGLDHPSTLTSLANLATTFWN
ncbi:LOW QUALITY PROTEIN: P-loop containing nucleoside triphosphate hydrolase protein [Microdochium trichocladiopsis]|uniref:P-loop containing nucleoside triphosphate hydrolase protein n=1 Tax=Microdochium trichocladiopsis TaxID=1682393 RepID=A0A9P9BHF9_9PEZI|nr:LOW QUALITY PROTEIN: P-loop containing nucleoside triphosphate hydrolase protein [Microdochium trichocladiopsis]KAH7010790.1 LOW QUALITY PROTEIN: P-loop containing nucleoside triphosphate hydrolase protein [Microdochium trichocladiopsis]